ncbi:phytosulfokines [Oryza brachyantha]|uniref:Phytosulfokine n=1 Tax=Oryza brachyantha TaxID=4533 RepID=J3LLN7_ORYBR|nr:phytosulfokines [Oryza brachyantha]
MACSSKLAALFLVATILLCLICTRSQAARPEPGSNGHKSQGVASTIKSGATSGTRVEMHQQEPEASECLQGGEAEEECLMRRTLVAHTDYIYTQGSHH